MAFQIGKISVSWATLFTIAGLTILIGLGSWQIQRMSWKEDVLATINKEYERDPYSNPISKERLMTLPDDPEELVFERGTISGRFLNEKDVAIISRTYEGNPGYHIITPFQLKDGSVILVNRGWASISYDKRRNREEFYHDEYTILSGVLRLPEKANLFVPENSPSKDKWYQLNVDEIGQAKGIKELSPYVFYVENDINQTTVIPVPFAKRWQPNNNHAQYAMMWYLLGGALVIIHIFRFMRPRFMKEPHAEGEYEEPGLREEEY